MTTVNSPRIEAEEVLDRDEPNGGLDEIAQRMWRRSVRSGTWDPATIDFTEDRKHYVALAGREVPPPPEERGPEQLVELYHRRLRDIFGPDVAQVALPSAVSGGAR